MYFFAFSEGIHLVFWQTSEMNVSYTLKIECNNICTSIEARWIAFELFSVILGPFSSLFELSNLLSALKLCEASWMITSCFVTSKPRIGGGPKYIPVKLMIFNPHNKNDWFCGIVTFDKKEWWTTNEVYREKGAFGPSRTAWCCNKYAGSSTCRTFSSTSAIKLSISKNAPQ